MGSHAFFKPVKSISPSGMNLEARAIGAGGFAAKAAGAGAQKDIAAASALYKAGRLTAATKDAASAAPGPKKV
jgi:hypothetical protein